MVIRSKTVKAVVFVSAISILAIAFLIPYFTSRPNKNVTPEADKIQQPVIPSPTISDSLQITAMRQRAYPGSKITIEQTLSDGNNYHQYLTSYRSDGLKIYALLTIPVGDKPRGGWPVILFNHGYIDPRQYQTFPQEGQYAAYYPVFSRNGYVVFKPDYRGNGNSEGQPEGAYYSPAYAIDDLNAIASIKQLTDPSTGASDIINPNKIGIWGHSLGGNITLRDLVVDQKDIKAAVIWGGVVGSYNDLLHWHDPNYHPSAYQLSLRNRHRTDLEKKFGSIQQNPAFWNSIDPTFFVKDISAPVQLHVGAEDEDVPPIFSQKLYEKLLSVGKTAEYYTYAGADHNISQGFEEAMQRSLAFFEKYLK